MPRRVRFLKMKDVIPQNQQMKGLPRDADHHYDGAQPRSSPFREYFEEMEHTLRKYKDIIYHRHRYTQRKRISYQCISVRHHLMGELQLMGISWQADD